MADYSLLNDPDMKEIFDSFIVETKEIFDKLDLDLVELEKNPEDPDLLNDIFRSFHTVKGTSGFLGLERLQQVTHRCEDILNILRKGKATLNDEIMETILGSYDAMAGLLEVIETQFNEDYPLDNILARLDSVLEDLESGKQPETKKTETVKKEEKQETAEEEKEPEEEPAEEEDEAHEAADSEPDEEITQEQKTPAAKSAKSDKAAIAAMQKKGDNTIRVDVGRLNELLNFVQELVLGRNRLTQLQKEAQIEFEGTQFARDLSETSRQIDLMTTELQLAVMKTRMVKIGKVFNKFPRLVRDLSKETNKEIKLEIYGEDTELDKTLIEEINDPLVHLVRNSIDHGIETPDVRRAAGKDPAGTIQLSAEQEGNNILISIKDDGKGIDPEVIKQKAIDKGLVTEEKLKEYSLQEVYGLLFAPGFSTAEKVTNISGRGVGMDVVKTNVAKLRGIINIESEPGQWTNVVVKLPLTLAIIQGLVVSVIGETLVVPLSSVIEVVRISKSQIKFINQKEVINLRDTVHPLVDLGHLMYENGTGEKEQKDSQYVVIVGVAEKRFGIKVDQLVGQREIVIKNLGNYLGNVEGIAGATIMGDGKVIMILDLAEMLNKIRQ